MNATLDFLHGEAAQGIREVLRTTLFEVGGTAVSLGSLIAFTIAMLATFKVSKWMQRGAHKALSRTVSNEATVATISRLTRYLAVLIGFTGSLQIVGIDLATLFAAGAIFAVAIGFAMQNIAQNFVSGFIILVERTIKPGDVLEVDGMVVKVSEVGIRSTVAQTRDNEELIIPNAVLVQNTVKNYTHQSSIYRIRARVGVSYGSDMHQVRAVLEQAATAIEWRTSARDPLVLLLEFGTSSVDWEVGVWIDNPWDARILMSKLYETIWFALKANHITIAFPQVDVHFDPGAFMGPHH